MRDLSRILVLTISATLIAASPCFSQVYYVSPSGKDNAPGTEKRPWKTLDKAFGQLMKADSDVRLVVGGGAYTLTTPLEIKGVSGRKVVIEAAPGESPVIRGDKLITGFKKVKGKEYLEADLKAAGVKDYGNPCVREGLLDLYWKGKRQRLARYPNEGFLTSGKALGETRIDHITLKEGVFSYIEDRISGWAEEKDPWIYGYYRWNWSDQYQKVASIDTEGKVITLSEPWHHYGYKDGFRYYGINLLCELDSPGEYYVDREKGKLYWFPAEGYSPGDEVSVSVYDRDYMLVMEESEDVTVKGLAFEGGRRGAICISGSRNILLDGVRISCFGGDGVNLAASRDVSIEGCLIETMGHGGVKAEGGDRKTVDKSGYVINNTIIKDFSLFKHTYEPAVLFKGCGLTVTHCEFSGSTSSAMRIDGAEALVEFNYFHDLVRESDDQGGIDMWFNYGYRGVVIRYNLWEDIKGGSLHGAAGVRFDDMISGQLVYGNIFKNVGSLNFGAVQIHGGKDNVVENNVFYSCHAGVSFSPWSQKKWDSQLDSDRVKDQLHGQVDIDSPLFLSHYPELREGPRVNVNRNWIRNNLAVGCPEMFLRESGQNVLKNNSALFLGEGAENLEPLEYYLDPEVLASFGLKPIPYGEIGPKGAKLNY